ncbi:MAG: hydrolase [Peptococcaceae bacterium]|nr:hydrolase [Peptococcaceae bacterium]
MRIALIQMDIAYGDPAANLAHARSVVEKAIKDKPDVIILPEMWNTSYALKNVFELADDHGVPSAKAMQELAREHNVNIIAGSVADRREDKVYNTSYIFNRQGEEVTSYSKIHLFGLMQEGEYLVRGNTRALFTLEGISCGVIICYDLRFPELSRALALAGMKVLFVPAQWPHPRMHPWRTLLQARAIENQVFVAAVNRVGKEGKAEFFGHSMVVDPLGEIIVEGEEKEQILIADIDLTLVEKVRTRMTCFSDRIPEAYL